MAPLPKLLMKKAVPAASLTYFQAKRFLYRRKIDGLIEARGGAEGVAEPPALDAHRALWKQLVRRVDERWYAFYHTVSGQADPRVIPEDVHYCAVEPVLNNHVANAAFRDKNLYDRLHSAGVFPTTIVRDVNGILLNAEYHEIARDDLHLTDRLDGRERVVVKPSLDSGQGQQVRLFGQQPDGLWRESVTGAVLDAAYLRKTYGSNFVVQEYIEQLPYFAQFNETSLNTTRVYTYRSVTSGEISVRGAYVRMGAEGNVVDNGAEGGLTCLIEEDGRLSDFALDKYGVRHHRTNGGRAFAEIGPVPEFRAMRRIAKEVAFYNFHDRLLGFDFCVRRDGTVMIVEINNREVGINPIQMMGRPLFGEHTGEVVDFCRRAGRPRLSVIM